MLEDRSIDKIDRSERARSSKYEFYAVSTPYYQKNYLFPWRHSLYVIFSLSPYNPVLKIRVRILRNQIHDSSRSRHRLLGIQTSQKSITRHFIIQFIKSIYSRQTKMKVHSIAFLFFASQSVSSFVLPLVGKQVIASSRSYNPVTFVNSEKVSSLWATTDSAAEDTSLQRDADVIFTIIDTYVIKKYRNVISILH